MSTQIEKDAPFRMAVSKSLDEKLIRPACPVMNGVTHALSNMLMPLREYPAFIFPDLAPEATGHSLLADMQLAADRLCEINQNLKLLCMDPCGNSFETDLASILPLAIEEAKSRLTEPASITVDLQIDVSPAIVKALHDALYHSIRHLCTNAFEAMMDTGGALRVELHKQTISAGDPFHRLGVAEGTYFTLSLKDTGKGIDPALCDNVFDPFVTTRRGEGCGLGLSLVYQAVVVLMHGHILYAPDCAPGAEFILFFPAPAS